MNVKVSFVMEFNDSLYNKENIKEFIEYRLKIKASMKYNNNLLRKPLYNFIKTPGTYEFLK